MPDRSPSTLIHALLRSRRTLLADVDLEPGAPERLLVRSDLSGTFQLYELSAGQLTPLTALPEPVTTAHYVPGARRAVLAIDRGGNERHQLYLLDIENAAAGAPTSLEELRALTDEPSFVHQSAGVSPDGRWLAYVSNRANGVDFDLWLCELDRGQHRLLYAGAAWLQPGSGFSPDGRLVSVLRPGERPLDVELLLVDVDTGQALTPLAHPHEAAVVGAPAWVSGRSFYAASSVGRDFAAVVHHDLSSGVTTPVPGTGERFDAEVVASRDGAAVIVIENRDGADLLWRLPLRADGLPDPDGEPPAVDPPQGAPQAVDPAQGAPSATDPPQGAPQAVDPPQGAPQAPILRLLEPGVTSFLSFRPPILSADGTHLYYTLSTPRRPGDVHRCHLPSGLSVQLTHSPHGVAPDELVSPELAEAVSFDGQRIPLFVYRPAHGPSRPPVVVHVHGGPEAQARRLFNPQIQALVGAGYGVVVPNVRGSTGYGKRYASLDDTTRRLDAVRDLAAVHGWLAGAGFDSTRAAVWGASYGGYMVLAALAFQSELWAAGVDIVGISNLVSFLENTSAYRRSHRELEYGSLARDRDFLLEASPLTRVEQIRAPLFVIHGRNDPRVPVSEAEQLVQSLRRRGIPCQLLVYDNEGHGLARLENQLDAYPRAIEFLERTLGPGG